MDPPRLHEDELDDAVDTIAAFIRRQVDEAGADGVVLGLSGGVDSATVAGLAARAVGPADVAALMLAAEPTTETSRRLAGDVAAEFDLELEAVPMDGIGAAAREAYDGDPDRTAVGNLRARSRMLYWYLVANAEDRLVLGGGNRTEWLTGYFTKYGDIAVDCLPLGDLYKGEVRQLARHLGVPDAVVDRAPTAELWADQTDEAELGMDYDTLDTLLARYIDGTELREDVLGDLDVDGATLDRVESLVFDSQHKRRPPPTPGRGR